jgi:DNA-binding phage protein
MVRTRKNPLKPIPYDPLEDLLDEKIVGGAFLEYLQDNDHEGTLEVIAIYLEAINKKAHPDASFSKSTFYKSLKSKNPTLKTLAKLVSASMPTGRK